MRLPDHNYLLSVIVTVILCATVFLHIREKEEPAKMVADIEQNPVLIKKTETSLTKKSGLYFAPLMGIDFQNIGIAAWRLKKNAVILTKNFENLTNIYETNSNSIYEIS